MSSLPQRSATAAREPGDECRFGQVQRRDRRRAAGLVDALLDRFERAGGAGGEDDVRARRGQRLGGRGADAAARAGDERELAGKRLAHRPSIGL